MVPVFDATAEALVQTWLAQIKSSSTGSIKVNTLHEFYKFTFDSLCETVFGENLNSISDQNSRHAKLFTSLIDGLEVCLLNINDSLMLTFDLIMIYSMC